MQLLLARLGTKKYIDGGDGRRWHAVLAHTSQECVCLVEVVGQAQTMQDGIVRFHRHMQLLARLLRPQGMVQIHALICSALPKCGGNHGGIAHGIRPVRRDGQHLGRLEGEW